MRNTSLALTLSCLLLAGVAFAQQTPSGTSSSTSATQAPAKIPAPSTAPANPLTDAQARQMFEVTGAIEMKDQLVHGMMNYLHSSMPFLPKDVSDSRSRSSIWKLRSSPFINSIFPLKMPTASSRSTRRLRENTSSKPCPKFCSSRSRPACRCSARQRRTESSATALKSKPRQNSISRITRQSQRRH